MTGQSLRDIVEAALRGDRGWSLREDGFWCHVRTIDGHPPRQGWKLHVSATPASAPTVLARCAEVLIRARCAFKFAADVQTVGRLVSKSVDRAAGGKFMTAYPSTDEERLRSLAAELDTATAGLAGPGILSDRRLHPGSLVHYRFGAFTATPMLGADGHRHPMLITPGGSLTPDRRRPWFNPPDWAPPDPFRQSPTPSGPVLLNGRYVVRQALRHSFAGGVYRADDRQTGSTVIVKQARPHTAISRLGDACDLRRNEAAMLQRLAATGVVPRFVELFEQDGDLFLVEECLDGTSLREWLYANPDRAAVMDSLADVMAKIHDLGLVIGDFNPGNAMVCADGRVRLIDLETMVPKGSVMPRRLTLGYQAPWHVGVADPAGDKYALDLILQPMTASVDLEREMANTVEVLLGAMDCENPQRLWPTGEAGASSDPFAVYHGAAGVLATLVRVYRASPNPKLKETVQTAADWIRRRVWSEPRMLPGLHFGRSGTAWALFDAGRLLDDQRLIDCAAELMLRLALRGPSCDVTHGLAGAGLTHLHFGDLVVADQIAAELVRVAQREGQTLAWPIPASVSASAAGARHLGFAHGIAGIATFLLAAGRATGESCYLKLAGEAAEILVAEAIMDDGAAYWPAVSGARRRTHWCSGSSGVGTFLLRMWQHTEDPRFARLVAQSAEAVYRSRAQSGISQCHGLAGDAEFLLDLADVTGLERYRGWARELATAIYACPPEEPGVVADYGVGLAGVLAFLVRLLHGGPRLWLPDLSPSADPQKGGDHGDRHRDPANVAGGRGSFWPLAVSEQPAR